MSKGALGLLAAYWPEDTPRYGHIPLRAVTDITIHAIAETDGNRPALIGAREKLTYGQLSSRVRRFAGAMRNRCEPGTRVAIALSDPADLVVAALGAFEAQALALLSSGTPAKESLAVFSPGLVIGSPETIEAPVPVLAFDEMIAAPEKERAGRQDFRAPILALARPDQRGEVLHNHRSLVATATSVGAFFMLAAGIDVLIFEPPTRWHTLSVMLGAWHRGSTVLAGWGESAAVLPERVDYIVCSWEHASRLLQDNPAGGRYPRIEAGAIVAVERPFSVSSRRRLSRHLGTPVLTLLGRNDLGPVLGSHPTWFLEEAVGIPLPNVDTRPLNPADGAPLNIGWDAVEYAEIGVKSALAPAGGTAVQGWLRSEIVAAVDPTGLFFLRRENRVHAV